MSEKRRRITDRDDRKMSREVASMQAAAELDFGMHYDEISGEPKRLADLADQCRGARPQPKWACMLMAMAIKLEEPRLNDDAYVVIEDLRREPLVPWLLSRCSRLYSHFDQYHQAAAVAVSIEPKGNSSLSLVKFIALRTAAEGLAKRGLLTDAQAVVCAIDPEESASYNRWVGSLKSAGRHTVERVAMVETLASFNPEGSPIPIEFAELIRPGVALRQPGS